MGIVYKVILCLALYFVLTACFSIAERPDRSSESGKFSIALIGDFPYSKEKLVEAENLMEDLDSHQELSFIIHDGDIKGGNTPCENAIYDNRLATFNRSTHPLFYIFGDNEWTDCHRDAAGRHNPFERLSLLRRLFADFSRPLSLGLRKLPLTRQSESYPENIRWLKNNVRFVGLNTLGSNNGLITSPRYLDEAKTEYALRNKANLAFLAQSFESAKKTVLVL